MTKSFVQKFSYFDLVAALIKNILFRIHRQNTKGISSKYLTNEETFLFDEVSRWSVMNNAVE